MWKMISDGSNKARGAVLRLPFQARLKEVLKCNKGSRRAFPVLPYIKVGTANYLSSVGIKASTKPITKAAKRLPINDTDR